MMVKIGRGQIYEEPAYKIITIFNSFCSHTRCCHFICQQINTSGRYREASGHE